MWLAALPLRCSKAHHTDLPTTHVDTTPSSPSIKMFRQLARRAAVAASTASTAAAAAGAAVPKSLLLHQTAAAPRLQVLLGATTARALGTHATPPTDMPSAAGLNGIPSARGGGAGGGATGLAELLDREV